MEKPISTLFMLTSIDGKITTGSNNSLDFDKDLPKIVGVKEGLNQYYELEKETDLYSLNSGKVLAKIGINKKNDEIKKMPVNFLVIDNKPHLNKNGLNNLLKKSNKLFIITTNKSHPAFEKKNNNENMEIIYYKNKIDFIDLFSRLKKDFKIDNLTIQTGGELNSVFLKNNLIDKISIVMAPILVGGKNTPSLIDGDSIKKVNDIMKLKVLKLEKIEVLKYNYIQLKYNIINQ